MQRGKGGSGMPLDGVGKRYVELLYQQQLEALQKIQQTELQEVIARFVRPSGLPSGPYLSARAMVMAKFAGSLVAARAQAFAQAYEKSGQSLNHAAIQEIIAEIEVFRDGQRNHLRGAVSMLVTQNSGGSGAVGLADALAAQADTELGQRASSAIRDLRIKHHENLLNEATAASKSLGAALGKQWDVFISHASEDKESFVRDLATALEKTGLRVWFDETTLTVGDSLRAKIDEGLSKSRFGVVVLSQNFFAKSWPQHELDGLVSREVSGVKVILPVWHNIDFEGVRACSPTLAGRLAAQSSHGMKKVVRDLRTAMGL